MMQDLHTHTVFSDGKSTPEEMVKAAVEKGLTVIGISDHSYTFFDESYCIPREKIGLYRETVSKLREKYAGKIDVKCGIEQDYYSEESTQGYDYVIGSIHYLRAGEKYIPVDESADVFLNAVRQYFGGDIYALAEEYYRTAADVARKTGCDIIGHFDLVTKYTERSVVLDENNPRYIAAWQKAVDTLIPYGKPFEINTGAISRGYRTTPYPSKAIRDYIRAKGGKFILSSDSHRTDTLCFGFEALAEEVTE